MSGIVAYALSKIAFYRWNSLQNATTQSNLLNASHTDLHFEVAGKPIAFDSATSQKQNQDRSYLFRIVPRIVPRRCAIVVIHKKRPACLRVNFDLPARWQRIVSCHRFDRRQCFHTLILLRSRILCHYSRYRRFKGSVWWRTVNGDGFLEAARSEDYRESSSWGITVTPTRVTKNYPLTVQTQIHFWDFNRLPPRFTGPSALVALLTVHF